MDGIPGWGTGDPIYHVMWPKRRLISAQKVLFIKTADKCDTIQFYDQCTVASLIWFWLSEMNLDHQQH